MITAPTKIGQKVITRIVDVFVEERRGTPISIQPEPAPSEVRIITLTDRKTGAVIELDEHMMDYLADSVITPAERMARRVQAHYDANPPHGVRVHVKARTAHKALAGLTVEGRYDSDGSDIIDVLISCGLNKAGDLDLSTLSISGDYGRKVA